MSECASLSQAFPVRLEGRAMSSEGKLRVALSPGCRAQPLPGADSVLEDISLSVKWTEERDTTLCEVLEERDTGGSRPWPEH